MKELQSILKCPVCNSEITKQDKTYKCINNHSFDISKKGYTNLLLCNEKKSKIPGDSKEMLISRRDFLNKGYYKPIYKIVRETIEKLINKDNDHKKRLNIADVGCGEGYYLSCLKSDLEKQYPDKNIEFYGIDIAKDAVRYGAQRTKEICWLVGSSKNLPFMDNTMDYILAMFTTLNTEEKLRVLNREGKIISVSAGEDHLSELKDILYSVRTEKKKEAIQADNAALNRNEFKFKIKIESREDLWNLLSMTPHSWRIPVQDKERIKEVDELELTIHIHVTVIEALNSDTDELN